MCMAIRSRLDEFEYGRNQASMSWVICPWISKHSINHFVYILAPSFLHQFWLYLYRMFITIRSWMSSILKELWMIELELRALDFIKIALFCLVYTLATINLRQPLWNIYFSLIMDLIGLVSLELWALEF